MNVSLKEIFARMPLPIVTEEIHREEILLPAGNGVRLRTQFLLPVGINSAPTIVVRSCYPSMEPMLVERGLAFARRGFGFVLQWCRGTGGSEGEWEPNVHDRADGLSLMDALERDDRIGPIGYLGDSYLAFTGWVMADAVPSKVKTMVLGVYGCDRYASAYKDGLFRQDILTAWAMGNAGRPIEADYIASAAYRPQTEVDEALWGGKLPWYRDWITNPDRDSAYWSSGFWKELSEIPGRIKIPLFIIDGWYDHHLESALNTYNHLLSSLSRAHTQVQIGPWNHSYGPAVTHQNLNNAGAEDPILWFDRVLRKGELPEGRVRKYVIGADQWREYPLSDAPETILRAFSLGNGTLLAAPPKEEGSVAYDYDPLNPVNSHGAESLFATQKGVGSLEQPAPDWRPDVKSFVSEPLAEPIEIHGRVNVKLFVESDAEDTSFTAKLMEVFPDGTAVNIRGSITTLAYRNGRAHRGAYTPGETVEINIGLWDVAWKTQPGSRLRLDVSSSDFPQYSVHPNLPGVWSQIKDTKIAHETVRFGGRYASCVELPTIRG